MGPPVLHTSAGQKGKTISGTSKISWANDNTQTGIGLDLSVVLTRKVESELHSNTADPYRGIWAMSTATLTGI